MRLLAALAAAAALALPAATASASRAASACSFDREYLQSSIRSSLFSIAGGRIAVARASNADVQALGRRLVDDHGRSLGAVQKLARALHVAVPGNLDAVQHWELNVVSGLSGSNFDRRFAWLAAARSGTAVQDATTAAGGACSSSVRKLAKSRLAELRAELKLAEQAQRSAGAA